MAVKLTNALNWQQLQVNIDQVEPLKKLLGMQMQMQMLMCQG